MDDYFMKAPCKHCPFRSDVTPFLHPERAEELAYLTENPYADFSCHKTTEYSENEDDMCVTEDSKTCAGFLAMQVNNADMDAPEGFTLPLNVYCEPNDMVIAYEDEWEKRHSSRRSA